ncbi:acyltransferase [Pseudomonas stutzeri]|uniref:Acyltransferase n=1 Tax=Stutzerimonas stutzeri TaxID=316 RepID=A0A2N8RZ55_STUST|nr:acyltransferase family protein [Stutzerimonas stutzeri]MCQ4297522.1 acyltransferase [Stutzerimonas stutzeri]PNF79659.1 acyltransferase [Stutzerimonas stutzeri]
MERLAHIDALRGGAAVLLMTQILLVPALEANWLMQHGLDTGLLACLWFLLGGGFIVPASLHAGTEDGRGFVIRRLLRLLPVYLVAVLLTAIVLPAAQAWLPGVTTASTGVAYDAIGGYGALPPLLLFYALCLALQALGLLHSVSLRAGCALLLLAAALLLALVRQLLDMALPVTLPLVLSLMFFASIWYEAQHESSSYARRRAREYVRYTLKVYLLVIPVVFIAGWSAAGTAWPRELISYALAIATFLLFTSRLPLRAPALVWLGSLSYSLYLLLPAMQRLGERLAQALELTAPTASVVGAALGLLLAIGSALLCRHLLDLPLAHAGKRLTGQRDPLPLVRLHSR